MTDEQRRRHWDERHAGGDFEGHGPNETLVAAVAPLQPGTALELAAGSGTNAIWLASQGWRVTAVDWSAVALSNARAAAAASGVEIDWLERDLFTWTPPARGFDLVVIVYLHLVPTERKPVYRAAAAAVAPGGHLVVIGHDRSSLDQQHGPIEGERLLDATEVGSELIESDRELTIERAEVVQRTESSPAGSLDALLILRRTPVRWRSPRSLHIRAQPPGPCNLVLVCLDQSRPSRIRSNHPTRRLSLRPAHAPRPWRRRRWR